VVGLQIFEVESKSKFNEQKWREHMKKLMKSSGGKQVPTMFLMRDTELQSQSQIEDINNLMVNGVINGVFQPEDYELIF